MYSNYITVRTVEEVEQSEKMSRKLLYAVSTFFFFFSSRRRHTRLQGDWSSDVCSSDLARLGFAVDRQREFDRAGARAQRLQEREISVDDMARRRRRRHAPVREQRVQGLPTVRRGEADPERRPRRHGDHTALDQPLEIDRHV